MDEYEPITGELRGAGRESNVYHVMSDTVDRTVTFDGDRFDGLCDDIDSVHARLERENESLREKVKHQSAQLSEVQGALERRNNGELKRHWQKELDRLKAERDSMAAALDAAQGEHAFAPESHYMMLPKDADGVPIHVGDVMESKDGGPLFDEGSFEVRAMRCDECGWEVYDRLGDRYAPSLLRHYHEPTVKDVLREVVTLCHNTWKKESAFEFYDVDDVMESGNIAEYAAKLRLAGEK